MSNKKPPTGNREVTSAQVARIAGRILALPPMPAHTVFLGIKKGKAIYVDWRDVRKLAASALTQTNSKESIREGRGSQKS